MHPRVFTLGALFTLSACLAGCSIDGEEDNSSDTTIRSTDDAPTRIGGKNDLRIPRGARLVGNPQADGASMYRPTVPGTIYVVDATDDYVVHQQRLLTGQSFHFEPAQGRARVGKGTVFARDLPSGHDFKLYFVRDPSN